MTDSLEPRIRPLVESLSSLEGVSTFSSCEGHDDRDSTEWNYTAPHVTFNCESEETLKLVCDALRDTSWRVVLDDAAFNQGGSHHYTLRYVSRDPAVGIPISELQSEIEVIAELLGGKGVSKDIEDNFPRIICSARTADRKPSRFGQISISSSHTREEGACPTWMWIGVPHPLSLDALSVGRRPALRNQNPHC